MPSFGVKIFQRLTIVLGICILSGFGGAVLLGSLARYGFSAGSVKLDDFISYSFATLVVLSVFVGFLKDAHVRVNMFAGLRQKLEKPAFRILYALPFLAIAFLSFPTVQFSWSILEGSREANGLGGLFLVKTMLPVSCVLIAFVFLIKRDDNE